MRPTKDYINRIAQYIPHRMISIERLKSQIFPEEHDKKHPDVPTIFTTDVTTQKSELNIQAEMKRLEEVNLRPVMSYNRGLVNIFRGIVANKSQRHDLLHFHDIGQQAFENRIASCILASAKVPLRRKKSKHLQSS